MLRKLRYRPVARCPRAYPLIRLLLAACLSAVPRLHAQEREVIVQWEKLAPLVNGARSRPCSPTAFTYAGAPSEYCPMRWSSR